VGENQRQIAKSQAQNIALDMTMQAQVKCLALGVVMEMVDTILLVMYFVGACGVGVCIADALLPLAKVQKFADKVFRL